MREFGLCRHPSSSLGWTHTHTSNYGSSIECEHGGMEIERGVISAATVVTVIVKDCLHS